MKEKDKVASLFVAIGVFSLLVCAGAAFLILQDGRVIFTGCAPQPPDGSLDRGSDRAT